MKTAEIIFGSVLMAGELICLIRKLANLAGLCMIHTIAIAFQSIQCIPLGKTKKETYGSEQRTVALAFLISVEGCSIITCTMTWIIQALAATPFTRHSGIKKGICGSALFQVGSIYITRIIINS